jgi:hypothetical protein
VMSAESPTMIFVPSSRGAVVSGQRCSLYG